MSEPLSDMRVLVAATERASFTAAASDLGLSPSAVSKLVSRLERRLGVRLLQRTTRRVVPTPEGETYVARARAILAEIEDMEAEVSRTGLRPEGRLRVNSGTAFALHHLVGRLPDFLARHPHIDLDLSVTDRVVDVVAENADVAIRSGLAARDERLVERPIGAFSRMLVAAPAYLARAGAPKTPADIVRHACIVVSGIPVHGQWPFRGADGATFVVEVAPKIAVDDAEAALLLAIAGAGLVRLGDMLAANALRDGRLVAVLPDVHVDEKLPIAAVYPPGRQRLPKVRVFLDWLEESFGDSPWRCVDCG